MLQIYFNISYIFIIPSVSGLLLGLCFLKSRKTYIISAILLAICMVLWCIIPNINTHGNEGFGIILWMYSLFAIAFSVVEAVKLIIRKFKKRKGEK